MRDPSTYNSEALALLDPRDRGIMKLRLGYALLDDVELQEISEKKRKKAQPSGSRGPGEVAKLFGLGKDELQSLEGSLCQKIAKALGRNDNLKLELDPEQWLALGRYDIPALPVACAWSDALAVIRSGRARKLSHNLIGVVITEEISRIIPGAPAFLRFPLCPKCSTLMALRDGQKGQFFGCAYFPKCRSIENVLPFLEVEGPAHGS